MLRCAAFFVGGCGCGYLWIPDKCFAFSGMTCVVYDGHWSWLLFPNDGESVVDTGYLWIPDKCFAFSGMTGGDAFSGMTGGHAFSGMTSTGAGAFSQMTCVVYGVRVEMFTSLTK